MPASRTRIGRALIVGLLAAGFATGVAVAAKKPKTELAGGDTVSFSTVQTNNNGPAENPGNSSFATCDKGKPIGAGMAWRFTDPDDPNVTPAAIRELDIFNNKTLVASGTSDTDAVQTQFNGKLICLKGKAKKGIRYRTTGDDFASGQADNNGATVQFSHTTECRSNERAIGWFNSMSATGIAGGSEEVLQLDTVRIRQRAVQVIVGSDTDADSVLSEVTAVCLKNPEDYDVKVKLRKASDLVQHDIKQANNAGGVIQVPGDRARCRKVERLASGGGHWRFADPEDPADTPAQLQDIALSKRAVRVSGGSDVNASSSQLLIQAVCLGKKG